MLPDLAGLASALNAGEVRFIVIGAVAVAAHGHIRATPDLDIVPEPTHEGAASGSLTPQVAGDKLSGRY
jgi:hypothetical protein